MVGWKPPEGVPNTCSNSICADSGQCTFPGCPAALTFLCLISMSSDCNNFDLIFACRMEFPRWCRQTSNMNKCASSEYSITYRFHHSTHLLHHANGHITVQLESKGRAETRSKCARKIEMLPLFRCFLMILMCLQIWFPCTHLFTRLLRNPSVIYPMFAYCAMVPINRMLIKLVPNGILADLKIGISM